MSQMNDETKARLADAPPYGRWWSTEDRPVIWRNDDLGMTLAYDDDYMLVTVSNEGTATTIRLTDEQAMAFHFALDRLRDMDVAAEAMQTLAGKLH